MSFLFFPFLLIWRYFFPPAILFCFTPNFLFLKTANLQREDERRIQTTPTSLHWDSLLCQHFTIFCLPLHLKVSCRQYDINLHILQHECPKNRDILLYNYNTISLWKKYSVGGLILSNIEFIFRIVLLSKMALCDWFFLPFGRKAFPCPLLPSSHSPPSQSLLLEGTFTLLSPVFSVVSHGKWFLTSSWMTLKSSGPFFSSYFLWLPGSTWHPPKHPS